MASNTTNGNTPVRVLKKVRRQFINKTPDGNELQSALPAIQPPANSEICPIKASLGFLEKGRKVWIGCEFLNLHFNISSTILENRRQSKVVTLNLSPNENNTPIPWEYTAKRLESYGDLGLATWAHRIRHHEATYAKTMSAYHELLRSNDPQVQLTIRKTQRKTLLTRREIENKYPFHRYLHYLKDDTHELLACSYSEEFLKEIGHTPESFVSWTKENGIPKIFETSNEIYQSIIKQFLNYVNMIANPIRELEEKEINIYDKDGIQRKIKAKFIGVLELTASAPFYHCYLIVNKDSANPLKEVVPQDQEVFEESQLKKRLREFDNTTDDLKSKDIILS